MDKRIKPLKWIKDDTDHYHATTPFGNILLDTDLWTDARGRDYIKWDIFYDWDFEINYVVKSYRTLEKAQAAAEKRYYSMLKRALVTV